MSASKNLFENNIMYGSASGALYHHCGLENESKNNIVHRVVSPDNGQHQYQYLCRYQHLSVYVNIIFIVDININIIVDINIMFNIFTGQEPLSNIWGACEANSGKFQSFSNHHNIYYFENTEGMKLYKSHNWFDEKTVYTDNLFYSLVPSDEFKGMFPPSDITFADLPSVGAVRNKWDDPQFVSVANQDYQLADDSPAKAMGIVQIRLDNFGIQNDRLPLYLN